MEITDVDKVIISSYDNVSLSFGNHGESPNNNSTDLMLDQHNDAVLVYRLPAILYTAIMMVLGLPGNMVVFYIYFFKWRQSTSRMFILFIAALDMINCATTLPMEIYIMRYSVKIDKPILCKVTRFSTYAMNSASAIILVGIAIDRFIHICRPHSRPFSSKTSKYICVLAIMFAVASTWPSFVLYGTRVVELGKIKGYSCLLQNKFDNTPFPLMYLGLIFLITMALFVVLVVFYCLIGAKIYRHRKSKQKKCTHLKKICEADEPSVDADSGSHYKLAKKPSEITPELVKQTKAEEDNTKQLMVVLDGEKHKHEIVNKGFINSSENSKDGPSDTEQYKDSDNVGLEQALDNVVTNKPSNQVNGHSIEMSTVKHTDDNENGESEPLASANRKRESTKRMMSNTSSTGTRSSCKSNAFTSSVRYLLVRGASTIRRSEKEKCPKCVTIRIGRSTLMLFLITLAYILSFVPFYIIVIVRQSQDAFVQNLSRGELMAYHLFVRSYLLSSAINPFIYSFCNAQFREYCRDLFLHAILRRPQSKTMSKLQRRY